MPGKLVLVQDPRALSGFQMQNEVHQDQILCAPGPGRIIHISRSDTVDALWVYLYDFEVRVGMVITRNGFTEFPPFQEDYSKTYERGEPIMC